LAVPRSMARSFENTPNILSKNRFIGKSLANALKRMYIRYQRIANRFIIA
jgi:hypothetical protein